ncbi:hypothetical protein KIN20_008905 [Parelaphostrongylus tenuis]|uniref:Uncharacterized protein n=1 Tax=Parelaphostrongylus tenuis TaxID=148309 RepID=A0AAD5MR15_PARTN|nr:hypothetical protein KIN20_008905 [Parelaphostrongylus tenuis]
MRGKGKARKSIASEDCHEGNGDKIKTKVAEEEEIADYSNNMPMNINEVNTRKDIVAPTVMAKENVKDGYSINLTIAELK